MPLASAASAASLPMTFALAHVRRELVAVGRALARRRGRGQRLAGGVVNELDVDVFVREADAHARALLRAADFLADAPVAELLQLDVFFPFSFQCVTDLAVDKNYYWTVLPSLRWTCSPT